MTVTAYIIGPPLRAPMRIGITHDVEAHRAFLETEQSQEMRVHDFVVTDEKTAAQIVAMTHAELRGSHLAGELFDVSPGQARLAFQSAKAAVQDVA